MKNNLRIISTDEEIKIFSDPYRMRIIETFMGTEEPLTTKKVADSMGEVPAKVHYHVQKLLKIKIIELDHIEVINGINAKYYKLVNDSFSIEMKKDGSLTSKMNRISKVQNILINHIDAYKKDVLRATEGFSNITDDIAFGGMFYRKDLYLNEEDAQKVQKIVNDLIDKYSKNDKDKERHSMLIGVVRNQ